MQFITKYKRYIALWLVFEAIAVFLWLLLGKTFYLFNFTYIGTVATLGLAMTTSGVKHARMMVQFAVGLYMLLYLGYARGENMQIEGFWYYLSLGVFHASVIHYIVAKIAGPLVFGRAFCGYGCWTALALDFLPYKKPQHPRHDKLESLRIVFFLLSILCCFLFFKVDPARREQVVFASFIIGNLLYYAIGILLAFLFKDNRAFCKYICPITMFLKPASYFARIRIEVDADTCISCGKCTKACPMNVDMLDIRRSRKNGTECILCYECKMSCPVKAIR